MYWKTNEVADCPSLCYRALWTDLFIRLQYTPKIKPQSNGSFKTFQIVVAVFSFVYGNPLRLINGYDSFGNTCGVKHNDKFSNLELSGLNTIDRPYLFFLDVKELRQTLKICVKECPTRLINNKNELYSYYQDRSTSLCRYDFNMNVLLEADRSDLKLFNFLGPCPPFPVYESVSINLLCIPYWDAS